MGSSALLEREGELEVLASALDAARAGSGQLLVIEGHAGLGKSQLLSAARGFAKGTGVTVLAAAGAELERDFPFGVALQLFEPVLAGASPPRRERLLSGAAGLAGPLVERGVAASSSGHGDDVFPLLHGLYWLTSNLAEQEPLLLAVDDAHWADTPSLRFLLYLAQRLAGLAVAVVVTRRPGEAGELAAKLAGYRQATRVVLGPLSRRSVERLVGAAFADRAEPGFSAACAEVTGGNPLLVHQLLAALTAGGVAPVAGNAPQVRELGPEAVSRLVLLRLSSLPPGASELARALAVLGGGATLRRAAALAGLELGPAGRAADALGAVEILQTGEPLAFAHPIVRSAIYAELPAAERARLHTAAAVMLRAEDAPPDQTAAHLLAGEPAGEEWVVESLMAAAERAVAGGAPASAARFLRRALAEPPSPERRADVLVALGRATAATGDPEALGHLEAALRGVGGRRRRAEVSEAIGRTLMSGGRHREAADAFDRGLRELEGEEGELALRLKAGYVSAARGTLATLPLAVARLRPILRRRLTGATAGERSLLAHVAYERALAGERRDRVRAAAGAALGDGRLLAEDTSDGTAFYHAVEALAWADELDGATDALDAAVADARRRGSVFGYATACHARAQVHYLAGRLEAALGDVLDALQAAGDGWALALPAAHAVLGRVLLDKGRLDEARDALRLPGGEERWEVSVTLSQLHETRGWLMLRLGDAEEALAAFLECGRRQAWVQASNPAVMAWRSGAALAAASLEDVARARNLAGQELGLARGFGAPRPLGIALRTAGLVERGEAGLERLAAAVRALEGSPARLELARARTELGAALRRGGRRQAARDELRRALDLAHRCGAGALAERAREELAAAGARPRRARLSGLESLTASERRVAGMAASGATNREIAQALFVTVKTVEWHLRNAYLKLGIASRRELAAAMEESGEAVEASKGR